METVTGPELAQQLTELLNKCVKEQQKYRVTTDEGNAVIMSEENFDQLMLTLEWLATTSFIPSNPEDLDLGDASSSEPVAQ